MNHYLSVSLPCSFCRRKNEVQVFSLNLVANADLNFSFKHRRRDFKQVVYYIYPHFLEDFHISSSSLSCSSSAFSMSTDSIANGNDLDDVA